MRQKNPGDSEIFPVGFARLRKRARLRAGVETEQVSNSASGRSHTSSACHRDQLPAPRLSADRGGECRCQQSAVYFAADIAPSRIFEINHCGFHVLVAEPSGNGSNVHTALQMHGGKRVPTSVKVPPFAIRPVGTAATLFIDAAAAMQLGPVGHPLAVFEKLI